MTKEPIKIDKHVPLPGMRAVYPFSEMEVGDSFAVPISKKNTRQIIYSSGSYYKKRYNSAFGIKTKTVTENGVDVFRVWRVK